MPPALSPKQQPRPFSGFYLQTACKLDAACPGYLNRVLHASALKRSAHFAAYPEIDFSQPEILAARLRTLTPSACEQNLDPIAQIARGLLLLPPCNILKGLYDSVPDGLLGLLSRLGPDPLPDREDYRLAFSLFADPVHKARAKLLRQTEGRVTPITIKVVARLDPVLLHKSVLDRLFEMKQVEVLHAALALIRAAVPGVTDDALRRSLHGLSPSDHDLSEWIARWLRRMERLPLTPPIGPGDLSLRLLHAPDMVELGRRFRNCAADRIARVALGGRIYYEWIGSSDPAVVELRCLSNGGFVIEDIRGLRNRAPDPVVADAIRDRLSAVGVFSYRGSGHNPTAKALTHLLGAWDLGVEGGPEHFLADLLSEAA